MIEPSNTTADHPEMPVTKKRINVALQGGGSHGAYAWGVLDRLLADDRIEIEAVSGTSAGAINAVVMAEGLVEGGRARARAQLTEFWERVAYGGPASGLQNWGLDKVWGLDQKPAVMMFAWLSSVASPYQFNPLNINPLRDLLLSEVDFDKVQCCTSMRLFISATNVRTGQIKIFTGAEITADAVLASACLPTVFQAVEINGEAYWDGGYMGNPAIEPFLHNCESPDVLLVQVNPIRRKELPHSASEIADRVNEVSFNAPLLRELHHVEFINGCLRRGHLKGVGYREIFLHRLGGGADLHGFPASSKLDGDIQLLRTLHDLGEKAADTWLATNFDKIGHKSTMDLSPFRSAKLA